MNVHESLKPYEDRVETGHIRKVISPCGRLVLYNYTDHCTYERAWDEYTMSARGIIFEKDTGKIVARPFKKFFNIGEHETTFLPNLPKTQYHTHEKLDGSLGIIYYYDGKWDIATRGSFTSDQANYARLNLLPIYSLHKTDSHITILTEIIYPENKIVVNYGDKKHLVLIGAQHLDSGKSLNREELEVLAIFLGMPIAKVYPITIAECIKAKSMLPKDEEGFVVHWPQCDTRVKIKGDEYMKIAKIMAHMTPLAFWEVMGTDGKVPLSYLEQIPEELRPMWEPIVKQLETRYQFIKKSVEYSIENSIPSKTDMKAVGLYLNSPQCNVTFPKLIFPMLRRGECHDGIMKIIRPKANEFSEWVVAFLVVVALEIFGFGRIHRR